MEIITGKKPNEPEFGENRDIVHWVTTRMAAQGGANAMEVLDKRLSWSLFKDEVVQALRIALRCTCSVPAMRPSMNEVVQLLIEGSPSKSDSGGFRLKQSPGVKAKLTDGE